MKPEPGHRAHAPTAALAALMAVLAVSLAALSPLAHAACNTDIAADTPDARFAAGADTVTDLATGLVWKRCAEGLSGTGCASGSALSASWADALARVAVVNAAAATLGVGSADWRLPNRNELASLVERKCVAAAINTTIFPATPAQSFWSASPYAQNGALAWLVDFNAGDVGPALKTGARNLRLVRAGP